MKIEAGEESLQKNVEIKRKIRSKTEEEQKREQKNSEKKKVGNRREITEM